MNGLRDTRIYWLLIVALALCAVSSVSAFANGKNNSLHGSNSKFSRLAGGQYVLSVDINGSGPYRFMIDTAATRTSLFEASAYRVGLQYRDAETKLVNDITRSRARPVVSVNLLEFGGLKFENHLVVVLPNHPELQAQHLDGILGLDVLDNLILSFSHKRKRVNIRAYQRLLLTDTSAWDVIGLMDNPYTDAGYGLLFFETNLAGNKVPTLFDMGADFTSVNWQSVEGTNLYKLRQQLHDEREVIGAVGSFKPKALVRVKKVSFGVAKRKHHEFFILDFENLPIMGAVQSPLVIAGVDILGGRDFILDLVQQRLLIARRSPVVRLKYSASRIRSRAREN